MAITLHHQTADEFVERLKRRFKAAEKLEKARIATWIYDRFTAGNITAAQIKTAFGLTDAQLLVFRDRLMVLREHYLAIEAERAEE
jgi:hypothetical protein